MSMYAYCDKCEMRHNVRYNCQTHFYEDKYGNALTMAEALECEIRDMKDDMNERLDPMMQIAASHEETSIENDKRWWDFVYHHYSPAETTPLFQISDLMGD